MLVMVSLAAYYSIALSLAGLGTPRAMPAAPGLLANPPAERLTPAFFARAHDGAEPTSAPPPFAQMVVR